MVSFVLAQLVWALVLAVVLLALGGIEGFQRFDDLADCESLA